jgi:heptosyltransferase-2
LVNKYGNKIIILCYPESKKIYELVLPGIKYQVVKKEEFKIGGRIASRKARQLLKKIKPGIIVDFTGSIASASLIFNSKATKIVGFNKIYFRKIYSSYISKRIRPHLIDMYLDVVGILFPLTNVELEKEYQVKITEQAPILIYPFAGSRAKEWNINKYIELSKILNQSYNCSFIDNNLLTNESKKELIDNKITIYQSETIDDLISILKKCSLLISNDSGPIYIANILNKPTFTIYGPTNPEFSLPYGKYNRMIRKKLNCSPESGKQYCFTKAGLYCPSYECMNQLSLNEVKNSILTFINEIGIKTKE